MPPLRKQTNMSYHNIREEELKNKIAQDYFWLLDCTKIVGNVDFCVSLHSSNDLSDTAPLLWAEAKKGVADIQKSISQLVLTIGKARTFDKSFPPAFLGAFDAEKIAFVPYSEIVEVFYQNDFNWNVTPSNHETKEFKLVHTKVKNTLDAQALIFYFGKDDKELKNFIQRNFIAGKYGITKTRIDKNNFMVIYNKWLTAVKPSISADWDAAKKIGIIDGDFYLADLLSKENNTLKDKLFVLLKSDTYHLDRKLDDAGFFSTKTVSFKKNDQTAHTQFWNKYERPPKEEYWDYIVGRRDLLVPQDVRERKGSFFTPQIWVELSQKYLADTLGENWQDEYYIWDCACGTGNLLAGLTNKYNIFASTLDKQDIDVIHDRIQNGANLLENHVFQFDFLNDDFDKLPKNLQEIINNEEKRKKLVVYINPPYAEAGSVSVNEERTNKSKVATDTKIWEKYKGKLGLGIRELYVQFFIRIHQEISNCILASFSTLKYLSGDGLSDFRKLFKAEYKSGFVVPANTFDNVTGSFPISFLIWNLGKNEPINEIKTNAYNKLDEYLGEKSFFANDNVKRITGWITQFDTKNKIDVIGYTGNNGPDFQNNNYCHISSIQKINSNKTLNNATKYSITKNNLFPISIYFAVRQVIEATWLNDRDQFLFPNDSWKTDLEFQNDCLAFALFHGQNKITTKGGTNHFIPFSEQEVDAGEKFESNFMVDFIKGKLKQDNTSDIFGNVATPRTTPLAFSVEAKVVFDAGRLLWKYYHKTINNSSSFLSTKPNANASLYDIREYFQGRNAKGTMNHKSEDEEYTKLITDLRGALKVLAKKIEVKVYEYGFLK